MNHALKFLRHWIKEMPYIPFITDPTISQENNMLKTQVF